MIRKPKERTNRHRPIVIEKRHGSYGSFGYRSASVATSEGRSYPHSPGSAHEERDRKALIGQSRAFMRNNGIYKGMIERMIDYIIGNGFELQLTGASKTTCDKIEKLWRDWNRRPEVRNLLSGSEVARMVLREMIVAGDTGVLKTNKGLIQHFEAEQIDGRKGREPGKNGKDDKQVTLVNGIKKDKLGRPVKFNLCPWKASQVDVNHGRLVDAVDVLFLTSPERPSQIRGVPTCQASFPMLHRINDICDSEAIAWQLISRIAVTVNREDGATMAYTESKEDPNKSADQLTGDLATRVTQLDYALIFHASGPNEKISGVERNIPGKDFGESLRMFLRLVGLPLGLPLELILLDWTKSNYSQTRGVMIQAYDNFIGWQRRMEDFYYQPLFEWKLGQWAAEIGKTEKLKVNWIKKEFPWIDQLKEAEAYATQVERGFITHNRVCKSLNMDRADIIEQREKEITEAIEITKRIKTKTGIVVPWQILAGLKATPDKKELAKPADKEDGDEADEKNNQGETNE